MLAALRQREFALLWVGQLVSSLGDLLLIVALPFFVYERTGSSLATGAMFMVQALPRLVLGSVVGVFVDRWDRRWTMVASELVRALVLLALVALPGDGYLWVIYTVAAIQSTVGLFFGPARSALIPHLVPQSRLMAANALNVLSDNLTRLVAPPLGGVLMAGLGLPAVVLLDSASFVFSGLTVALIVVSPVRHAVRATEMTHTLRPVPPPDAAAPLSGAASAWVRVWRDWLDGVRLLGRQRWLATLFALQCLTAVGNGITTALFVVFMREVLQGGAVEFGWWLTAQGVGGVVASVLTGHLGHSMPPSRLIPSALTLIGVLMLAIINIPVLVVVLVLLGLMMVAGVTYGVSTQTLYQNGIANHYRGRVFGALGTTNALMSLAGMGLASVLGDSVGVIPLFNCAAGLWLLAAFLAFVLLPKSLEEGSVLTAAA